jgi:triacylglycerol lipase
MPHKSLEKIKKTAQFGISILNGIVGDKLQHTALGIEMGFFHQNKRIVLDENSLMEHFTQSNKVPTNKVCILVHGVTDNETTWSFQDQNDYGSLLAQDMQYTPFYLRYNSGLHISDNGKILADLLENLYKNYPVAITEICIIAHSMGGLVTHSACYNASEDGLIWPQKVKQIFLLATPHLGSYLEKFANLTTNILEKVPNWHTRLVGKVINLRSAGIKDLRYGYLLESDWKDQDPDRLLKNNKMPPPVLENTAYYVISGRLTDTEKHWVSQLFGDILVSTKSAVARSKNTDEFNFSDDNHFAMAKTYHFQLQSSLKVYEQIKNWLQ